MNLDIKLKFNFNKRNRYVGNLGLVKKTMEEIY